MLKNVKIYNLNERKQLAVLNYLRNCGMCNNDIAITMNSATLKNIEDTYNVKIKDIFKEAI